MQQEFAADSSQVPYDLVIGDHREHVKADASNTMVA
jgi:hypothetical protein